MTTPNFLGIGAIKAGTTWVADTLAAHPDIFVAAGKELHYFSLHYDRGPAWYLGHFRSAGNQRAVGEYSVTYMDGSEQTAERIHAFNPDFRLIVSVREPVARAFSQYRWMKQMGEALPPFLEALRQRPHLVRNSCYAANLEPFWRRFPERNFLYVRQSDIRDQPDRVRRELYGFLGVDMELAPDGRGDQVVGETIQPRARVLERLRIRTHQAAMRHGAGSLIELYRRLGLSRLYRRLNNTRAAAEVLTEAERREAQPLFEQDLQLFKARTGIDIVA